MCETTASEPPWPLVERARRGDARALEELVLRYRESLLERIRLMMGDEARRSADSLDFLQGVFAETLAQLGEQRFENERALLRWMTAVARNDIRDCVRRRRERALGSLSGSLTLSRIGDPECASPATVADQNEELERLVEALEDLTPDHRRAIELRDLEGLSFDEVGERLGRSADAAQMLHARALLRLGRILDDGRDG